MSEPNQSVSPRQPSRRRLKLAAAVVGAGVAVLLLAAEYVAHHAEPLLRAQVVKTLSAQFDSPVALDGLSISVVRGIEVQGSGLRVLYLAGPQRPDAEQVAAIAAGQPPPPMLSVKRFLFRISLRNLWHRQARLDRLQVEGVALHVPPHAGGLFQPAKASHASAAMRLAIDAVTCRDVQLYVETATPGKDALRFDIPSLDLGHLSAAGVVAYRAVVVNPHPRGNVTAIGHAGPWQAQDPSTTPIDGRFVFDQADLSTIKGLRGTLQANGSYSGVLGALSVQANTAVPAFALDVSGHAEPLLASVQSTVDGTTGDTHLNAIQAKLGSSAFTAQGAVVRQHMPDNSEGHDIQLAVQMPAGRMEDLLALGMKTQPPVMHGAVGMTARLHIPPGKARVAQKIQLAGDLSVRDVKFTSAKLQDEIDGLSLRAQGRPEEVKQAASDHKAQVASQMTVRFTLANELMTVPTLHYEVPGARIDLDGVYTLEGDLFEFKGHVKTAAKASDMVTGWKAMLLKPLDGVLAKNGAGVELPIVVTGAKGDFRLGLAMGSADESTSDMANDLKARKAARPQ